MKLPNGYGSVYNLGGKRRKPFAAVVTVGWDPNGKQIRRTIGYYKNKKEALQALADYHNDPYDLDSAKLTFSEIYDMWSGVYFDDETNRSTRKNYTSAYKFCSALYNMRISDIRLVHLQSVVDSAECGSDTLKRIKILYNRLFSYCIQREIVTKNYAEFVVLPKFERKSTRKAFSSDDIDLLWQRSKASYTAKIGLILIYSGVRINELLNLKKENLYLDDQYFEVTKSKTESGIRVVPIADKVLPLWRDVVAYSNCEYAITNTTGDKMSDDNFRRRYWHPLMNELGMSYVVHEARHTCISLLTTAGVNPTIIKHIVGHKSAMSLTESVYTHFELQPLLDAINSI